MAYQANQPLSAISQMQEDHNIPDVVDIEGPLKMKHDNEATQWFNQFSGEETAEDFAQLPCTRDEETPYWHTPTASYWPSMNVQGQAADSHDDPHQIAQMAISNIAASADSYFTEGGCEPAADIHALQHRIAQLEGQVTESRDETKKALAAAASAQLDLDILRRENNSIRNTLAQFEEQIGEIMGVAKTASSNAAAAIKANSTTATELKRTQETLLSVQADAERLAQTSEAATARADAAEADLGSAILALGMHAETQDALLQCVDGLGGDGAAVVEEVEARHTACDDGVHELRALVTSQASVTCPLGVSLSGISTVSTNWGSDVSGVLHSTVRGWAHSNNGAAVDGDESSRGDAPREADIWPYAMDAAEQQELQKGTQETICDTCSVGVIATPEPAGEADAVSDKGEGQAASSPESATQIGMSSDRQSEAVADDVPVWKSVPEIKASPQCTGAANEKAAGAAVASPRSPFRPFTPIRSPTSGKGLMKWASGSSWANATPTRGDEMV